MYRALKRLYRHYQGFSHQAALKRLRNKFGFTPRVIYDIGAHHGKWTHSMRRLFRDAQYILLDANPDNAPVLEALGERHCIAALSEKDGVARNLYMTRHPVTTGVSLYQEQTAAFLGQNLRVLKVTTRRLDALAHEQGWPPPDLIKLDVQGAELDVLRGAGDLLDHCSAVIAEVSLLQGNAGAPDAGAVISGIEALGFSCVDLCKARRTRDGGLSQMDLLFVNSALYEKLLTAAGIIRPAAEAAPTSAPEPVVLQDARRARSS